MSKMSKRSAMADTLLLKAIQESPGLSLYELHNRLGWSIGKVDGSKDRLLASRRIAVTELNRNGRHVNLVYPRSKEAHSTVSVPKTLLHMSNPTWTHESIFYALDSANIGVTGKPFPEWEKYARFKAKVKPVSLKNKLILKIPKQFSLFYDLERKHYTPSVFDNRVLITIDGDIVTKLPEGKMLGSTRFR
jgi:hypothetical protein